MKKLLVVLALLFSTPAYADTVQGSIGGTVIDSNNTVITGSFDYDSKKENSNWQKYLDMDYIYNDTHGMRLKNRFDAFAKLDYNLDSKNYLQGEARYEYNQLGIHNNKIVVAIGNGYRLVHSKNMKLSFETSVGIAKATDFNEIILRESVWATYKLNDSSHLEEKFLIEHGKSHDYIRNKASIVFDISKHVFVSVTNIYTDDYSVSKITTFNFGAKF
jgi:putative salt-induced outer membrane protein YdiY